MFSQMSLGYKAILATLIAGLITAIFLTPPIVVLILAVILFGVFWLLAEQACTTQHQGLLEQMKIIFSSTEQGDLSCRADSSLASEADHFLLEKFNKLLEREQNLLEINAACWAQLARGEIPQLLSGEQTQDFGALREHINRSLINIRALNDDVQMLALAGIDGNLHARADVNHHQGQFKQIIQSFNDTLESFALPLTEAQQILGRISVNDFSTPMNDFYQGEMGQLATSINEVQIRFNSLVEIFRQVAAGDLSQLSILTKINRLSPSDELLPAAIAMMTTLRQLADQILEMNERHNRGETDFFIDEKKFVGAYQELAVAINNNVRLHINNTYQLLNVIEAYAHGDFKKAVPQFAGQQAAISQSMTKVRDSLQGLVHEAVELSYYAAEGNLNARGQVNKFAGDYQKIVEGMNHMLEALSRPMLEASDVLTQLSQFDLRVRLQGDYHGDLIVIKNSLNQSVEMLHEAMVDVAASSKTIRNAANEIAANSQNVAQGASEQASAIEQTSSSLEEMSGMTKQNADNTQQARILAEQTNEVAAAGTSSMSEMMSAMHEIRTAAEGTAQIIRDINEISFQTNLLALNAAVEAARAGDAGRGFAVVADEVRNLALRSKDAAKRTEELINRSVELANQGSSIVQVVGTQLNKIAESANKVNTIISEIAVASSEQARGIDQVNRAIAEMDKVVQQSAANSEQSSSTAAMLSAQAQELEDLVGKFQLHTAKNRGDSGLRKLPATSRTAPNKKSHKIV